MKAVPGVECSSFSILPPCVTGVGSYKPVDNEQIVAIFSKYWTSGSWWYEREPLFKDTHATDILLQAKQIQPFVLKDTTYNISDCQSDV